MISHNGPIGIGDGGREGAPKFGRKTILGQTSCNVRAADIFLEEGKTGTLYFLTVYCFSFHVNVEYSFEFRNPFLAVHFIIFLFIHFGQKCLAPEVNRASMLMNGPMVRHVYF